MRFRLLTLTHILLFTVLLLTACGFHLKGFAPGSLKPLPFHTLYVNSQAGLTEQLTTSLENDSRISLVKEAKNADATLTIYNEKAAKEVLTINSAGRTDQNRLIYRINARLTVHGIPYNPEVLVMVTRSMEYSDSVVLGKEQEEAMLWQDMRKDAADQLIRRLDYLKPATEIHIESSATKPKPN